MKRPIFTGMRKGAAFLLLFAFTAGGVISTSLHPVLHSAAESCSGNAATDAAHEDSAGHHCDHSQHGERFEPYHTALHGDTCVLCTRQHLDDPESEDAPLVEPRPSTGFAAFVLFSPDERPSSALRARAPPIRI